MGTATVPLRGGYVRAMEQWEFDPPTATYMTCGHSILAAPVLLLEEICTTGTSPSSRIIKQTKIRTVPYFRAKVLETETE